MKRIRLIIPYFGRLPKFFPYFLLTAKRNQKIDFLIYTDQKVDQFDILNAKNIENEIELVEKAAKEIETEIVLYVPRSGDIQTAENMGGTVSEFVKDSPMVEVYNKLADRVLELSIDE